MSLTKSVVVSADSVNATIEAFTALDQSGDRGKMNALAQRLGKEQPNLLQFAAQVKASHGDALGEAAVFYATLVWAMFDRAFGKKVPRLLPMNLVEAQKLMDADLAGHPADLAVHEKVSAALVERQPHLLAKLKELLAEDVKENAIPAEGAAVVFPTTQAVAEAFDAALSGRRKGQVLNPIVRDEPKVGRNDPCPCGSGKKWKRCHGLEAA
jgi:hypothetical protein